MGDEEEAGDASAGAERVTLDFESRVAGEGGADDMARHETVELPRQAVAALLEVARALSQGQTLHIVPHEARLTTQAAADLLGVSRPHLITLIDRGELECDMVGTHRRLRADDVLAYRERRNASRRAGVQELQRLAAELEGHY